MAAETSQTLDRGLRVLTVLAGAPGGLTVTELAGRARGEPHGRLPAGDHARAARAGPPRRARRGCTSGSASCTSPPRCSRCCATSRSRCCAGSPRRSAAPPTSPSPTARRRWRWRSSSRRGPTSTSAYRVGARHPLTQGAAGKAILLGREPADDRAVRRRPRGSCRPAPRAWPRRCADVEGLEASVGIVTLGDLDAPTAGPLVAEAASQLGALLHSRSGGPARPRVPNIAGQPRERV